MSKHFICLLFVFNGGVNMDLLPGERIDDLQRKLPDGTELKIIQNPNWFCFGIDAVLLSSFAEVKPNDKVMDLGTGTGIIPLLLAAKTNAGHIDALEIQKDVCEMATRSVKLNNLQDRIDIINADLVGYKTQVQYNVVTCNPPYKTADTGLTNPDDNLKISRHEVCCNLSQIINTASRILKPMGRFYMIHRPERMVDIMAEMRAQKLEPKRVRYIHSDMEKPPVMIMVEGRKCAKPHIITEPPLVIYNRDGSYTDEIIKIYN